MEPVIEVNSVTIEFDTFVLYRDFSLTINRGDSVTLLGPSGTGKTVLLKTMNGLIRPKSGSVKVLGTNLTELDRATLRKTRNKIGMLFQGAALFDSLSVYENVAYALREQGELEEREIGAIVEERLRIIGLPGIGHKFPPELSGGQKKRVGLARALASNPEVVLFDEPTTGLDPTAIRMIDELILRLNREMGITCVSVTHDIESAKRISTRWVLVNRGKILADGPVGTVSQSNRDMVDFITGNWNDAGRT